MEHATPTSSQKKLRIGIVLSKEKNSESLFSLLDWCQENPNMEICLIVILPSIKNKIKVTRILERLFWQVILKFESLLNISSGGAKELSANHVRTLKNVLKISIGGQENHDCEAFNVVKDHNLDILVAFDLNDICTKLTELSRLGIIGFNHQNSDQCNYPVCFEEVIKKKNKTSFNIIQILPNNQGKKLIFEGSFLTRGLFLSNKNNVLLRRNFYMQKVLTDFFKGKDCESKQFDSYSLVADLDIPYLADQLRYLIHALGLIKTRILNFIFNQRDSWNVGIEFSDWKTIEIKKSTTLKNPTNHYLADPFIFRNGSEDFCFVEDYDWAKSKGVIAAYRINNFSAERLGVVLEEPFHLSFPYIFKYNNKIYMLPESSANLDIRIYESIEFPMKWKLRKIIKKDIVAVDSMIFKYGELWWLFSNINPIGDRDCSSELSIFYSDTPIDGKWLPHEKNPVIFNPSSARNGGIVFQNKSVYRVAQNHSFRKYGGGGISVNQIIDLTPKSYREKSTFKFPPSLDKDIKGAHHLHCNGNIAVFDFLK